MSVWPMTYCKAFGFMPLIAMLVQKVWRSVWAVITLGSGSLSPFAYLRAMPLNTLA